eukprot:m.342659 g.342659  ORF g.342659 m.342659 type:complete len:568 (-) comp21685_c0_seq1:133-1836(-)
MWAYRLMQQQRLTLLSLRSHVTHVNVNHPCSAFKSTLSISLMSTNMEDDSVHTPTYVWDGPKARKRNPTTSRENVSMFNWSGTHKIEGATLLEPRNLQEVEAAVKDYHSRGVRVRPVGSAISPNGLGLSNDAMISMSHLDKVKHIDTKTMTVTVEAGALVQSVADAIRPHGMTLQNYGSIKEQQIGGFTQAGVHGTGHAIPPVNDQVVSMVLVTPGKGTLHLSENDMPDVFRMAQVGLGCFGVVTELTLKCVPAHILTEEISVVSRAQARQNHVKRIREFKHLKYLWYPYTDKVVVIANREVKSHEQRPQIQNKADACEPLRTLLREVHPHHPDCNATSNASFTDLRGNVILNDPLNIDLIKRSNAAEIKFWELSSGISAVDFSDRILSFECGGSQWVSEVAFPAGTLAHPNMKDMDFMFDILSLIEKNKIPAHPPLEQRWSSGSASTLSIVHSQNPSTDIFSWVGIIMYMSEESAELRQTVTKAFAKYHEARVTHLDRKYGALQHWAKLEPISQNLNEEVKRHYNERFDVKQFNAIRNMLDPKGILGWDLVLDLLSENEAQIKSSL